MDDIVGSVVIARRIDKSRDAFEIIANGIGAIGRGGKQRQVLGEVVEEDGLDEIIVMYVVLFENSPKVSESSERP